jgi:hypothetical protein
MVAHIDGDESNDAASNLAWTCRSCNTRQANRHKALGKGRRTNQMNPYNPSPDVAVLDAVGARLTIAPKIYAALPGMSKRDVDEALGRLYERRAIILHEHTMRSHGDDRARLIHYDGRVWVGSALRTANPAKKEGCTSIGQWSAMMNIVGHKYKGVRYTTATQDEVDSAWAMIMATPPAKRRAWNRQLHGLVRPKEKVPF